jgi:ABC-type nitrate/sulfonate/bicarbonate transport system ATPase subunit
MASLEFDNVGFIYEGSDRQVRALDHISLAIVEGEPIAIIGPSGCGKSTMLLLAAGLLAPTSGRVLVDGAEAGGPRLQTALILQDLGLLPWKTVADNASLGLRVRHVDRAEERSRAGAALERVGLADFAAAYPGELSGGMRQRLALARALALDADLLLMDEPLSALDALTREDLQDVLLELWRSRKHTQVLVTHSIDEAVFLGQRVVVLTQRPGRIAAIVDNPEMGTPNHRATDAFFRRAEQLRELLAAEGAIGAEEAAITRSGSGDSR